MQIHIYELNPYFIMQSSILSENLETGFAFFKWVWLKFCLVLLIATLFAMLIMTDALKSTLIENYKERVTILKQNVVKIFFEKELYLFNKWITIWDLNFLQSWIDSVLELLCGFFASVSEGLRNTMG